MLSPMFLCSNCGSIFIRTETIRLFGELMEVCPNRACGVIEIEWDLLTPAFVTALFYDIIRVVFDENDRNRLRADCESQMSPYDWPPTKS